MRSEINPVFEELDSEPSIEHPLTGHIDIATSVAARHEPVVDDRMPAAHSNNVARQTNHALDERIRLPFGLLVMKNDHVAAAGLFGGGGRLARPVPAVSKPRRQDVR